MVEIEQNDPKYDSPPSRKEKEEIGKKKSIYEDADESWILMRLWKTYDHNFLMCVGLNYFVQLFTISMGYLAVYDALKNTYDMQP